MVKICDVAAGSLAERKGIRAGDILLSVNGNAVRDVLDYRFYITEKKLASTINFLCLRPWY